MIRYEYRCDHGHWVSATAVCGRCPVYVLGCPCPGDLKRVGAGSRAKPLAEATR